MTIDDAVPIIKVLIIGPSGVGKSALLIRYCDNEFDAESSSATIGVDFKLKKITHDSRPYRLNLLDTAGQERFRTLSTSYYRGAQAVLLAYDVSSRASFTQMDRWFDEAEGNAQDAGGAGAGPVMFLVGCKSDVVDGDGASAGGAERDARRAVTKDEGMALAERRGAVGWAECSAKGGGEEVDALFARVVEAVVETPGLLRVQRRTTGVMVGGLGNTDASGGCC